MGEKCGTLCAYLVPQTGMAYLSFSVYTTTTVVNEIPTIFPKITICNSVLASTEYAYEIVKVINEQLFPTISIFNQSQMSNLSFDQMQLLFAAFQYYNIKINLNSFTSASRQKLAHSLDKILINCQFNGQNCSASDFVWRWDPKFGNCYSFNLGFNSSAFKESLLSGSIFGLKLNVYVGCYDKLTAFNTGW
jgi:hypothetical protein